MSEITSLNAARMAEGDVFVRGSEGNLNYFLLGGWPEHGAIVAMRPRLRLVDQGAVVSFKFRLMPDPKDPSPNWKYATELNWARTSSERRSACFGVGIGFRTKDDIMGALDDVNYGEVLGAWLASQGMIWREESTQERLSSYLKAAVGALYDDQYAHWIDGETAYAAGGRPKHMARKIMPESEVWYAADPETGEDDASGFVPEDINDEDGAGDLDMGGPETKAEGEAGD